MLRKAVDIARTTIDTPSAKKVKQEPSVGGSLRFGGAKNLPPVEQAAAEAADAATEAADFQFDPVQVEIERFAYLSPESLQPFMTTDGMLNHFKMHWQLRDRFPSTRSSSSRSPRTSRTRPTSSRYFPLR